MKLLQQVQLNPAHFSEICLKIAYWYVFPEYCPKPSLFICRYFFHLLPNAFLSFHCLLCFYLHFLSNLFVQHLSYGFPTWCSMCFQWHFFYLFLFWTFFKTLRLWLLCLNTTTTTTPPTKNQHPPNQTRQKTCASALSYLCQEASLGLFHLLCSGFFRTLFPPHIFACSPWAILYKQPLHLNLHTPSLFICINWCCWGVSQIAAWPSDWSKPMSEQIQII